MSITLANRRRGVSNGRLRDGDAAEHGFVPSAAAILAEWGADVVKVERPGGDPLRLIMGMGFVTDTGDFNLTHKNKYGHDYDRPEPDSPAYARP